MNEMHRQLAVQYFNETWSLLDLPERTSEQDALMIHMAHASLLHWSYEGAPKNFAIGEWQVSRVHAVLQQFDAATFHARRSLEIAQTSKLGHFLIAYAHEALARALAMRAPAEAAEHYDAALQLSNQIEERDSRDQLVHDLQTIELKR
jgi:hypothetical protein